MRLLVFRGLTNGKITVRSVFLAVENERSCCPSYKGELSSKPANVPTALHPEQGALEG